MSWRRLRIVTSAKSVNVVDRSAVGLECGVVFSVANLLFGLGYVLAIGGFVVAMVNDRREIRHGQSNIEDRSRGT